MSELSGLFALAITRGITDASESGRSSTNDLFSQSIDGNDIIRVCFIVYNVNISLSVASSGFRPERGVGPPSISIFYYRPCISETYRVYALSTSGVTDSMPPTQRGTATEPSTIVERIHARIGLLGDPSDQSHGACITLALENLFVDVILSESSSLRIYAPDESIGYASLADLARDTHRHGFVGGRRLLLAACEVFFRNR